MKTKTFILLSALILGFSCSVSEDADIPDPDTVSLKTTSPVMELLSKKGNKERLVTLINQGIAAKGNGNGVMVIENGADPVVLAGVGGDYWVLVYEIEGNFYKSPIDVMFLPNGEAQFKAKSKNFGVEVYTPDFGELLYSNLCLDEFEGNLHINLKGTYIELDDPFFGTFYTFDQFTSANNLQLTALVDDGVRNFVFLDPTSWDCDPGPNMEKKLKVTSLFTPGGNANIKVRGL